mmetsp:Transcript_17227/g.29770  ORF Transcript_17227/g.29770 Transcript_17227/m.29770 type:complete len:379 (+) Transcript_17227:57-1193(+)
MTLLHPPEPARKLSERRGSNASHTYDELDQPAEEVVALAKKIVSNYDTFLLDLDGVLWRGKTALPNAAEAVKYLRFCGKRVFFVSNNSTLSRDQYLEKFEAFDIPAEKEQVFSSSYAASQYVTSLFTGKHDHHKEGPTNPYAPYFLPSGRHEEHSVEHLKERVFVIGQKGLVDEMEEHGVDCLSLDDPDAFTKGLVPNADMLAHLSAQQLGVRAVVVGLDRNFTYLKLAHALRFLQDPSCFFVATNDDASLPSDHDLLLPGAGSIVAAVSTCSGRKPVVLGKPHSTLMDLIKDEVHINPARSIMFGDRIDTDIAFGKRAGLATALVLSGVAGLGQLEEAADAGVRPDYVLKYFGDLLHADKATSDQMHGTAHDEEIEL